MRPTEGGRRAVQHRRLGLVKVAATGRCGKCGKPAQHGATDCGVCRKVRLHAKRRKRKAEPRRRPGTRRPQRPAPEPMGWTE